MIHSASLGFLPLIITTILILVVTIIGTPLLVLSPFALLALAVMGLVGFTRSPRISAVWSTSASSGQSQPITDGGYRHRVLISPVLIARLVGLAGMLVFPITGTLAFPGFFSWNTWCGWLDVAPLRGSDFRVAVGRRRRSRRRPPRRQSTVVNQHSDG